MKGLALINLLLLAVAINGCTKSESVAGQYKAKLAAGESESSNSEPDSVDSDEGSGEGEGEGEGEGSSEGDGSGEGDGTDGGETATGDAAAGQALIDKNCGACHVEGGLGKFVLNGEKVDAVAGVSKKHAAQHSGFDSLIKDNIDDIKAAMSAAALRLQNKK